MSPALGTSKGVGGQGCRQPLIPVFNDRNLSNAILRGSSVVLLEFTDGLKELWKQSFQSKVPQLSPTPFQFLIQWHAAGCCVHCKLGPQAFAVKACLLMQEDIGNKLITLLSNDSYINIHSLVAVIFNMRKKILKILISNVLLLLSWDQALLVRQHCCLCTGLSGLMKKDRKCGSCLRGQVPVLQSQGTQKRKITAQTLYFFKASCFPQSLSRAIHQLLCCAPLLMTH